MFFFLPVTGKKENIKSLADFHLGFQRLRGVGRHQGSGRMDGHDHRHASAKTWRFSVHHKTFDPFQQRQHNVRVGQSAVGSRDHLHIRTHTKRGPNT